MESGKLTTYSMRCKHSDEVDKLLSVIQVCYMVRLKDQKDDMMRTG